MSLCLTRTNTRQQNNEQIKAKWPYKTQARTQTWSIHVSGLSWTWSLPDLWWCGAQLFWFALHWHFAVILWSISLHVQTHAQAQRCTRSSRVAMSPALSLVHLPTALAMASVTSQMSMVLALLKLNPSLVQACFHWRRMTMAAATVLVSCFSSPELCFH